MKIFNTAIEMHDWSHAQQKQKHKVALVPTMGALHGGHSALIEKAKQSADRTVVSIYINPTQFSADEDLEKYPRSLEADLELCEKHNIDAVFLPSNEVMYPENNIEYVTVDSELTKTLCGASRPQHFRGVTTVVAKLFESVQPSYAVFGEKDFQQLVVIKELVKQLALPIEIVGATTIREADGLAMSSRNAYLSSQERMAALSLHRSLLNAERLVKEGVLESEVLLAGCQEIMEMSDAKLDYAKIVDVTTLKPQASVKQNSRLLVAAFVGSTRLIDNCQLLPC